MQGKRGGSGGGVRVNHGNCLQRKETPRGNLFHVGGTPRKSTVGGKNPEEDIIKEGTKGLRRSSKIQN